MNYSEKQYMFRDQPLIIPLIFIISLIGWIFFIFQVLAGIPLGNHPAPDWAVWIIWVVFGIIFPLFFVFLKLETRVDDEKLEYRFFPVHLSWRKIPFSEIEKAQSIDYRPFRDFGGWGIRYGSPGKAYTISGKSGVLVTMKNGRKFILGSKHAEELEASIKTN